MNQGGRRWTASEVRDFLEHEELAYQGIDLPYGLRTPGPDLQKKYDEVFYPDLTGKSVLDVGSYLGAYCIEALRRGATRVVGWEINSDRVRQARSIAEICGLDAVYENKDIELDPLEERFDVVLGLNILHHMRHPHLVLTKLIDATQGRLVLEFAAMGGHDRRKLGISRPTALLLRHQPIIYVGQGQTIEKSRTTSQTYFFSPAAIERMVGQHRASFRLGQLAIRRSPTKDRFFLVADKPKLPEVIVVAGPTSAGKSTLIHELMTGNSPMLAERITIAEPTKWTAMGASHLAEVPDSSNSGVILHYDLLRPYGRSSVTHRRDEALDVLGSATRVTVVTLVVAPSLLRRQLIQSELSPERISTNRFTLSPLKRAALSLRSPRTVLRAVLRLWSRRHRGAVGTRHVQLLQKYEDAAWLRDQYERWFAYIDDLATHLPIQPHVVVQRFDDGEPTTTDDWRSALLNYPGAAGADGSSSS